LEFVGRMLAAVRDRLTDDGVLVVEVGEGRRVVERAFPRMRLTWLTTAGGTGLVFLATAANLATGAAVQGRRRSVAA
jgi:ribosomal protein L3 glutamine methyltransferase